MNFFLFDASEIKSLINCQIKYPIGHAGFFLGVSADYDRLDKANRVQIFNLTQISIAISSVY